MSQQTQKKNRMVTYLELAKYVHPDYYKQIITWHTCHLERLLEWFERPEEVQVTFRLSKKGLSLLLDRLNIEH